ncbi:MAG: HK97 gp10 family phage protein [Phycisphaerales bacterium]|jgi:hypothetical protein
MRVKVSYDSFKDDAREERRAARLFIRAVKADLRAVSFAAERRIKDAMPVDTGRARASWGHWTPGDLRSLETGASSADAAWEETDEGLTIEQGSNVEYIGALNDGHSLQAPAGFIDAAEEAAQRAIDQRIDERLGRL